MRPSLPLVLSLVLLGGCASPATESDAATTSDPTFEVTAGTSEGPPFVATDTMHLLQAPHAAATLPLGLEEVRTPVATTSAFNVPRLPSVGNGSQGANVTWARWELPRPARMDFVTGTALLFVEFQGTTANAVPLDRCYWRITLVPVGPATSGGVVSTGESDVCLPQPEALPTGIHELHVTFPGRPVPADAGDRLVLTLTSSATMTPGSSIVVLSGTPEHDSRITLNGLQVPLDLETYA